MEVRQTLRNAFEELSEQAALLGIPTGLVECAAHRLSGNRNSHLLGYGLINLFKSFSNFSEIELSQGQKQLGEAQVYITRALKIIPISQESGTRRKETLSIGSQVETCQSLLDNELMKRLICQLQPPSFLERLSFGLR